MAALSPTDVLQLAAVEEHLRNDEESSVDSKSVSDRISDSYYGRCSTPPRLERTNRKTRRRSSCTIPPEDASVTMTRASKDSAPLVKPRNTPLIESMFGMSVLMSEPAQGKAENADTFSLSTDSSLDSDRELEMRAEEIRADLRMQQLIEIAAVAERAAEAGHDSFTGLASTFGGDDGRYMKPLQIKRNNTYTEGQKQLPRPLLRRTHTETRAKRKVPVMALRHIDDLIPPMEQLHRHLQSHLHRIGVDTENSLIDRPIDLTMLEKGTVYDHESLSNSQERSFIQRMTRWVASSSIKGELLEEKKSAGLGDGPSNDSHSVDEGEFDIGIRLCAHITTSEFALGRWKPSPVKIPAGLLPPDEYDFEDNYATPYRVKAVPLTGSMLYGMANQRSAEIIPSLSCSEKSNPSPIIPPNQGPSNPRSALSPTRIVPIALFDDCVEEDDATAIYALGSRDHPKPFEITALPDERLSTCEARRNFTDGASEVYRPSLYITPLRLKVIRDTKGKLAHSTSSAMTWGHCRAGAFQCDPRGMSIDGGVVSMHGNFAASEGDLFKVDDDYSGGPTFLKPRSRGENLMLDVDVNPIGTSQLAAESTFDAKQWSS